MLLSLFVFNKRQTGETDKTQFFYGNSQEYMTQGMESLWLVSIEKLCLEKFINEKSTKIC